MTRLLNGAVKEGCLCCCPTLSSILLSLDPIELLPLSLARSAKEEQRIRTLMVRTSWTTFCLSSEAVNYLSLLGKKSSSLKTGPA